MQYDDKDIIITKPSGRITLPLATCNINNWPEPSVTRRDFFAAHALNGLFSNGTGVPPQAQSLLYQGVPLSEVAELAIRMADKMIKQLDEENDG